MANSACVQSVLCYIYVRFYDMNFSWVTLASLVMSCCLTVSPDMLLFPEDKSRTGVCTDGECVFGACCCCCCDLVLMLLLDLVG